jgi:hypothetical protein
MGRKPATAHFSQMAALGDQLAKRAIDRFVRFAGLQHPSEPCFDGGHAFVRAAVPMTQPSAKEAAT